MGIYVYVHVYVRLCVCLLPRFFLSFVRDLGFEFGVFVTGCRHALRSEWPFH